MIVGFLLNSRPRGANGVQFPEVHFEWRQDER
jgi:hypothetical protein